ncbi:MAG: BamA/TamA family outer membrane protein [Spirosomataceae bacterium]
MCTVKKAVSGLLVLVSLCQAVAQKSRFNILPFPVVYYTPETHWAYGAALTSTFRFKGDSAKARPSQVSLGVVFTQQKQSLYYLPFQIYLKNAGYYVYGEAGFYRYNYFYFGIGNHPVPKELYGVDYPRIKLNFLKKIYPHLYAGLRYQYEDYRITQTEPNGAFAGGNVPGTPRARTSGVGVGLFYDTRDVIFYPSKGIVADLGYFYNAPLWGGNVRFDRFYADISGYKTLLPNLILAGNFVGSFTWGAPPFNMLSELGGGKRMRGYYQGRFRDDHLLLTQAETRITIYRRWGGALFGSAAVLGGQKEMIRWNDLKYAYGVGLRFMANRRDRLNLRFDYARGKDGGNFYFTIGEAF